MKYTHVIMDHVGGPDVLHMQEDDVPEPKTGEVPDPPSPTVLRR